MEPGDRPLHFAAVEAAKTQPLAPPEGGASIKRVQRIEPSHWFAPIEAGEFWRYRGLIRFFLLRDVKTRYRQMHLGAAWMILRPLVTIVIFSVVFGGLAKIKSGTGVAYPLWVTPGVLVFSYVASALAATSSSLVTNSAIITKVYFPRLYVPISAALTPIVDFLLGLLVLFGLFAYYRRTPSWHVVFLPAFLLLSVFIVLGLGLWLASLTARYRDVIFIAPFFTQAWQFLTPVIYPASYAAGHRFLLDLNPMTAVVAGFRWSLLGLPFGSTLALETSIPIALGLTLSGLFAFRRAERLMADML
jgi:lipopolysaccharide transport system permease protein